MNQNIKTSYESAECPKERAGSSSVINSCSWSFSIVECGYRDIGVAEDSETSFIDRLLPSLEGEGSVSPPGQYVCRHHADSGCGRPYSSRGVFRPIASTILSTMSTPSPLQDCRPVHSSLR